MKRSGWEPHHTKKNEGGDTRGEMLGGDLRILMVQTPRSFAMGPEKGTSRVRQEGVGKTTIPCIVRSILNTRKSMDEWKFLPGKATIPCIVRSIHASLWMSGNFL